MSKVTREQVDEMLEKFKEMSDEQKNLLLLLTSCIVAHLPDDIMATEAQQELEKDLRSVLTKEELEIIESLQ